MMYTRVGIAVALIMALCCGGEVDAKKWKVPKQLRINKIHVPKPLKIGKPKTLIEVILPVCWGAPQDCRDDGKRTTENVQALQQYPYYVTARFYCLDRQTGRDSGTCDVTQASDQSCSVAMEGYRSYLSRTGDPCQKCTSVTDRFKYWPGKVDFIQGGPCEGWG